MQAVEKMEEKLEAAYGDQKRIFLIIFQRFIMILSEHLVKCDTDGRDFNTDWYRWTIGRLQQVFLVVSLLEIHLTSILYIEILSVFIAASRTSAKVFEYFGKSALYTGRFSYFGRFSSIRSSHKIKYFILVCTQSITNYPPELAASIVIKCVHFVGIIAYSSREKYGNQI